jgi:hypothetical protein
VKIWSDDWFESLSSEAKLLFIYLFTNPKIDQAGGAIITDDRIAFETKLKKEKLSQYFEELKGKVYRNGNIVFVKNFLKYQCCNPNFATSALKEIKKYPDEIQILFIECNEAILEEYLKEKAEWQKYLAQINEIKGNLQLGNGSPTVTQPFPNRSPTVGGSVTVTETETENNIYTNITNVMFPRSDEIASEAPADTSPHETPSDKQEDNESNKGIIAIPILPTGKNGDRSSEFWVTSAMVEEFQALYPGVDVLQELREIRAWNIANPRRRKTKNGILRHINAWLAREQNKMRSPPREEDMDEIIKRVAKKFESEEAL